jgi:toxin FitB
LTGFLLDTNVISELVKPQADAKLAAWYGSWPAADLYLSTITVGELAAGIELLPAGRRRRMLEEWLDDLILVSFAGRLLDFGVETARVFGRLMGLARRSGRPTHIADAQISAVALVHGLTVATRDVVDFAGFGVTLVNPFEGA